eukprot:CAMPEP_0177685654 /NCGR_PEP_ID=MMETSP0447-20121125/33147_2 /TAXON_ID=0 /ORGANISM="Stygamoeba regulata, Strain BSH-02190019" /LENGTH=131 /DNA_ID=CAMNT_0019195717 /DNA_START=249 /DNA_END=642 /DNA_ORIENTATION=-
MCAQRTRRLGGTLSRIDRPQAAAVVAEHLRDRCLLARGAVSWERRRAGQAGVAVQGGVGREQWEGAVGARGRAPEHWRCLPGNLGDVLGEQGAQGDRPAPPPGGTCREGVEGMPAAGNGASNVTRVRRTAA